MSPQTRTSAANSPVKTTTSAKSVGSHEESQPLKLFILPQHACLDARFLALKHPNDGTKKRFYFCPRKGLFEVRKVDVPTTELRSILFTSPIEDSATNVVQLQDLASLKNEEGIDGRPRQPTRIASFVSGYVNKSAELFVATPFDLVFILIPIFTSHGTAAKSHTGKALFQPIDDVLDPYLEDDKHLRYILEKARFALESAAAKICDFVEAGDERMFRLNHDMLFKMIIEKAQNAVKKGLPASLDMKFVKRTLEKPVMSIKREESLVSAASESSSVDDRGSSFSAGGSQCSTIVPIVSIAASEAPSMTTVMNSDEAAPEEIIHLQQLRTAWSFITSSCLSNQLESTLTKRLSSDQSPVDFGPLESYLDHIATLRAEALASRTLSGFGLKRGLDDDDASEVRTEKKRKQEEVEKRRKAGESRGVRDLKKVDVSGMKKMSAFFTKTSTPEVKS